MQARAVARGRPNFYIFGEIATDRMDPGLLAVHTRVDRLPAVLDFSFQVAVRQTVAESAGTEVLARLFDGDSLYEGGERAALRLPTFSNHDIGRFAYFARAARPQASDNEVLRRVILANAMLFTLRGVPVIYYGDEQGFAGDGGDQAARQDMFASRVEAYNRQSLVGTRATTAQSSFNPGHPLYRAIAELAGLRTRTLALRQGRQIVRAYGEAPGLFAVSRIDPATGQEIVVAFNTSTTPVTAQVAVDPRSAAFTALHGRCAAKASAPGSYPFTLAPLDYLICAAQPPMTIR